MSEPTSTPPADLVQILPARRGARLGLAALAGVLWAIAFPLPGASGLAWLAPGLLLASGLDLSPGPAFRVGYVAGLVHHLVALRWLLQIPFPSGAVAAWLALSSYCALFAGLWLMLGTRFIHWQIGGQPALQWRPTATAVTALAWLRRQLIWVWLAALWAALELVRGQFLSGFPWNFLGVTQWRNAPLLQLASVTGVYGISFVVCWVSVALAGAIGSVALQPGRRFGWTADLRVPLVVLLVTVGAGFQRLMKPVAPSGVVSLALLQPSIPQQLIWDDRANPERFRQVFDLTTQALAARPDGLIWPEGSMPDLSEEQFAAVSKVTREAGAAWIFGTGYGRLVDGHRESYNAAILVGADGRVADRYHKRRLVIFGEFVPFEQTLPFMKWLTPIGASFTPGRAPGRFQFGPGTNVVASPMICFEDVFPHHTREHVTPDTDFLLELTNNGWFGESSAQWQHCANAALRSVENGVPLVRCSNNGLTCWIDEFGRLHDLLGQASGNVYAPGVLLTAVPLRPAGAGRQLTFYHDHGDVFGWVCFGAAAVGVVVSSPRFRRAR